jgi:Tfp pilus assembly protein PilO
LLTKRKDYVIIGVAVVASLILAKMVYSRQIKEYDRIKAEITTEQEKAQTLDRIVGINHRIADLKKSGWNTTEYEVIGSRLGEMARARQIKIFNVEPAERSVEANFIRMPLKIKAEGTTEDLVRFLKDIETMPTLTKIQMITAEPVGSFEPGKPLPQEKIILSVDLTIVAYYFKP